MDVLISHPDYPERRRGCPAALLKKFMSAVEKQGLVIDTIAMGDAKFMVSTAREYSTLCSPLLFAGRVQGGGGGRGTATGRAVVCVQRVRVPRALLHGQRHVQQTDAAARPGAGLHAERARAAPPRDRRSTRRAVSHHLREGHIRVHRHAVRAAQT